MVKYQMKDGIVNKIIIEIRNSYAIDNEYVYCSEN